MPTLIQRFAMRLMPGRAEAIERESREWFVKCPHCGTETTIWDLGGVRYGARSRGKRSGVKCRSCGRRSMHPVERRRGAAAAGPRIEVVTDEALAESLAQVVNDAYAAGERGLWVDGQTRTTPAQVAAMLRDGSMLAAAVDGRVVGCAYVKPLDETTADLGLISVAPEQWGGGLGRELVARAEALMRSRGVRTSQLELLVPRDGEHPEKERLRAWYERLGYRVVRTAPFEEIAVHGASQLAVPCEFLIFRKALK